MRRPAKAGVALGRVIAVLVLQTLLPTSVVAKDGFSLRALNSCEDFVSNDTIGEIFSSIETENPDIAKRLVIGKSVEDRSIFGLRLSAEPEVESAEPEARIIGAIHGDECMGAEVVLLAVEWLVDGYLEGERFATRLIDNAELTFVPLLNPDGYTGKRASRTNANGVDLNRNFHFAWIGAGPTPFSEPETMALRTLSQDNSFTVGISYHTVSFYVNGPWNYTPFHPPDEALIQAMGDAYAGTSRYVPVFGWDWYDIQGDVNDWSLGARGTFDWTLELMSDTDSQWGINRAGLEGFLSFLFQGINGVVTDADTGAPLSARIEVTPAGAPIFTDPDVGDFHRILLGGVYDLRAVAEGYAPQIIENITVRDGETTTVDVALERDETADYHAFAVAGMKLPDRISRDVNTASSPYLNDTMVWNALGPPDGIPYALSANPFETSVKAPLSEGAVIGSIVLDMGETTPVVDLEGADLEVVSSTLSDDEAAVLVSPFEDGPFVEAARGYGTFFADLATTGLGSARYVKVVDLDNGSFKEALSGYDLDAVVNFAGTRPIPADGGITGDGGEAVDTENDSRDIIARSGGCACRTTAMRNAPVRTLLRWLLCL